MPTIGLVSQRQLKNLISGRAKKYPNEKGEGERERSTG